MTRSSSAVVCCLWLVLVVFEQHLDAHSGVSGGQMLDRDRRPIYGKGRVEDTSGHRPLQSSSRSNSPSVSASSSLSAAATVVGKDAEEADTIVADLRMPGVRTSQEDEYVCSAWKAPATDSYITQLEALAKTSMAHHMLLFGCEEPETTTVSVWKQCYSACRTTSSNNIIFAWARGAPPTQVPKDVGFQIGGQTSVRYLVLQIHYKSPIQDNQDADHSGLRLTVTKKRPKFLAGIFILLVNSLSIPPHSRKTYGDASCVFDDDSELHPFGFRVHAHELGRVISGYQVRNGTWNMIGKGNPRWPQAFYPVENVIEIKKSDALVARCTYDASDRATVTRIGPTHNDEMCNFYVMYYTNATTGKPFYSCAGNNVPDLLRNSIPPDSDVPPPENPALDGSMAEDIGAGGGHLHSDRHGSTGGSSRNEVYDERPLRGFSAGGGMKGNSGRGFNSVSGSSGYDDDSRYVYSKYDPETASSRSEDSALDWAKARGGGELRQPDVGYVNSRGPEGVAYEYIPEGGGGGADDTSVQDYMEEVAAQRSRYRHHYPAGGRAPGTSGPYYLRDSEVPVSRYVAAELPAGQLMEDNYDDGTEGNRRRLYDEDRLAEDYRYPGRTTGGDEENSQELHRINKSKNGNQQRASAVVSDPERRRTSWVTSGSAMTVVADWPHLGQLVLGEVTGVATDAAGIVYVCHRGSRHWTQRSFDIYNRFRHMTDGPIPENTVLVLSPDSGQVIGQWGHDLFYLPHGLTVDQSNGVWITDVALHQVMRFQMPETQKPSLVLGVRFEPGSDRFHFCQPTSVAVTTSGSFYVADGYCNNRIVMFSKEGTYVSEWGERSKSVLDDGYPAPSTFDVVHSLKLLEDLKMLCAADRENSRVQCFHMETGQFIRQIHPQQLTGRLVAISYSRPTGLLYVINGHDSYRKTDLGIFTIDPATGLLLNASKLNGAELYRPHDLASSPDGRFLYVAHIEPNKVWKVRVRKTDAASVTNASESKATQLANAIDKQKNGSTVAAPPVPVPVPVPARFIQKSVVLQISSSSSSSSSSSLVGADEATSKEETDFGVSLAIGGLLIVPVSTIAIITLLIRLRKSGKCRLLSHRIRNRRYSLSTLLSRRGGATDGFDRLRTDDNANHDELEHLRISNSDSEIDDVSTTAKHLKA